MQGRSSSSNNSSSSSSSKLFEIKVVLVGHVSAGKTTVLNALFRDKYGEVSSGVTTAGVNHFHVTFKKQTTENTHPIVKPDHSNVPSDDDDGVVTTVSSDDDDEESSEVLEQTHIGRVQGAKEILKEITLDNSKLRKESRESLQEKTFEIELEEELFEMRDDTKLTITDVPGINEARTKNKYKDYVADNWHTFDCVILVMDVKQGVQTEEQLGLLDFIQYNLKEKKDMPVIILGNKVDDPEEEEQERRVAETRAEIERIFGVGCRQKALHFMLEEKNAHIPTDPFPAIFPAFLSVAARTAFIYRTASTMNFERFQSFDRDLIDNLGKYQFGKKWKRIPLEERYAEAFKIIKDPEQYQEGIESSNFDKFLAVLAYSVGGYKVQQVLIENQLKVALRIVVQQALIGNQSLRRTVCSQKDLLVAVQLQTISDKRNAICSMEKDSILVGEQLIKQTFWTIYKTLELQRFAEYDKPMEVSQLPLLLDELIAYHSFAMKREWHDEMFSTVTKMVSVIRQFFELIFKEFMAWSTSLRIDLFPWMRRSSQANYSPLWSELSPVEWISIIESILLVLHDRLFWSSFSREKIYFEWMKQSVYRLQETDTSHYLTTNMCAICRGQLKPFAFCQECHVHFKADPFSKAAAPFTFAAAVPDAPFTPCIQSGTKPSFGAISPQFGPTPTTSAVGVTATAASCTTFGTNPIERGSVFVTPPHAQVGNVPTRGASGLPTSAVDSRNTAANTSFAGKIAREKLISFYQQYNPSKLAEVDTVLAKYLGKEQLLFRNLEKKYNLPSVFGLSPAPPPTAFGGCPPPLGDGLAPVNKELLVHPGDRKERFLMDYVVGRRQPNDFDDDYLVMKRNAVIQVPPSLSDPSHYGHLPWKFCQFMDSIKDESTINQAKDCTRRRETGTKVQVSIEIEKPEYSQAKYEAAMEHNYFELVLPKIVILSLLISLFLY